MNQLSQFLLEPQLEFRMSPSFSLVSLFWCRVKLWHDVGTDPGSGAKKDFWLEVFKLVRYHREENFTYLYKREKNRKKKNRKY